LSNEFDGYAVAEKKFVFWQSDAQSKADSIRYYQEGLDGTGCHLYAIDTDQTLFKF
jgi:hypothetical protein